MSNSSSSHHCNRNHRASLQRKRTQRTCRTRHKTAESRLLSVLPTHQSDCADVWKSRRAAATRIDNLRETFCSSLRMQSHAVCLGDLGRLQCVVSRRSTRGGCQSRNRSYFRIQRTVATSFAHHTNIPIVYDGDSIAICKLCVFADSHGCSSSLCTVASFDCNCTDSDSWRTDISNGIVLCALLDCRVVRNESATQSVDSQRTQ